MPRRNLYTEWDEEICDLYKLGASMREIAEVIHWSANFVRNRLIANDVEIRGRGGASGGGRPKVDPRRRNLAVALRRRGKTVDDIAAIMGHSTNTIYTWLKKEGEYRPLHRNKDRCKHGHAMTGSNLYVDSTGRRHCLTCKRKQRRESAARVRARKQALLEAA
jgi:transposase-like protein